MNSKIKQLEFEELLWLIFIGLSFLNIYGDKLEEKFIITNDNSNKAKSNKIFKFTLIITLFIYIYFLIRNYNEYKNANQKEKNLYIIKVLGSSLLISGIICLIYFQNKQTDFVGSPSI